MGDLTDLKVKNAKAKEKIYALADGESLFLKVPPTGSKFWVLRYRIDKRPNDFAIGVYPAVKLSDARAAARAARALVKQGLHPAKERKRLLREQAAAGADTFQANAEDWIRKHTGHWSARYLKQVTKTLGTYVYPKIGAHAITTVKPVEMRDIINGIADRPKRPAPAVAKLVKMWCSAIFGHAIQNLRCESDPTAPLGRLIKRVRVKNKTPLQIKELGQLAYDIEARAKVDTPVTLALMLLMHTFVRPSELRCAHWDEFDLDEKEWRIPASRMKMRETHVVPLTEESLQLLQRLSSMRLPDEARLFPNVRTSSKYMSETTLNRALERAGWNGRVSAHAFRATASTYLNNKGYNSDVIERQLAHKPRNAVRGAYNMASYMDKRIVMMSEWSAVVDKALNTAREQAKQRASANEKVSM